MNNLPPPGHVTHLLRRALTGEEGVGEELYELLYDHLRALAGAQMNGAVAGATLQPTALVHEVWLRLRGDEANWRDREHFLAVASRAMRFALVDHARKRNAAKRKGNAERQELDDAVALFEDRSLDLIALDEALGGLAQRNERQARIVELRFFGGMTLEESARSLDLSLATAERAWTMARAYLRHHLAG